MNRFLVAALVQLITIPAMAGLIVSEVRDPHTFKVFDDQSGLTWIAPRWSNGRTALEAVAEYEGFRLPTLSEVTTMFAAAGLPLVAPDTSIAIDAQQASTFRTLWADTQNVTGYFDAGVPGRVGDAGLRADNVLFIHANIATVNDVPPIEGHWLVSVPEPTGLFLAVAWGLIFITTGGRCVARTRDLSVVSAAL